MPHPKSPSGHRVGIINPLTLAGNEIKTILREHAFPFGHITLLDSTGKDAGALTDIGDEPAVVTPISAAELDDLDLVFFCGPPESNREWIERAERSYVVVELSQPSAIESGTLAVAGINLEALDERETTLISPHPIAIPIALLLHQIEKAASVEFCTAAVVQPASAFEQAGVEELAQQTISVLNIQAVPKEVFDRQLAFNLYPAQAAHEEFIVGQVRSLAAPRAKVALFVTQGTIFHGHTFSLFVKTVEPVPVEAVVESLQQNGALAMAESDEQFGTIDAAGRDQVLVAEVRADPSIRGGFWVWAVCDNLRRSSALNAVLIAEKVLFGSRAAN